MSLYASIEPTQAKNGSTGRLEGRSPFFHQHFAAKPSNRLELFTANKFLAVAFPHGFRKSECRLSPPRLSLAGEF